MGKEWRDCIVTMIDLIGIKKDAHTGKSSKLMRQLHQAVSGGIDALQFVEHAYTWNDSVLLLSYVTKNRLSFESAIRDAEKLKRRVDQLAPSFAIAVKGRTFPRTSDGFNPSPERVTIIKASSWAMANCFVIQEKLGSEQKPWYIDGWITAKLNTPQNYKAHKVKLFPDLNSRNVYAYDDYLWDE